MEIFKHPVREMVDGYWAGRSDGCLDYPEIYRYKSIAFKHGWLNGRDDRVGKPREKAAVLRARAEMILNNASKLPITKED